MAQDVPLLRPPARIYCKGGALTSTSTRPPLPLPIDDLTRILVPLYSPEAAGTPLLLLLLQPCSTTRDEDDRPTGREPLGRRRR